MERKRRHRSVTRSRIGASEEAPPAVGRPRSARAHQVVLDAALDLFQEGGYSAATIEAVAARSGVAKTTIYRSWPKRAALMVELLLKIAGEAAPTPSGPDPLQALRTELHLVARAADALPGRMLMALLGEAQNDPEVRDALLEGLFNPRRRATGDVIRKAQEQGAIRGGVSPLLAVDLIFGPLFYRRFLRQEPATEEFLKQTFELVLAGLAPRSVATGPARTRPRKRASRR
jgi:AcrR family transcriptional regulator